MIENYSAVSLPDEKRTNDNARTVILSLPPSLSLSLFFTLFFYSSFPSRRVIP